MDKWSSNCLIILNSQDDFTLWADRAFTSFITSSAGNRECAAARAACSAMMTSQSASSSSTSTSTSAALTATAADSGSGLNFAAHAHGGGAGDDESRLVENEVRSPVEDVVRETVA